MLKLLLLASLGLLASSTDPPAKPFDCGTDTAHASEDFLKTIQDLHAGPAGGSRAARALLTTREATSTPFTVDTVFHIVAKPDKKADITNDMPSAQLDVLNESYKPYSISFNLVNVTWTTNEAWATGEGGADIEMKKALRQGTYSTLNIYFQTDLAGGVLGRCTLPSSVTNGGKTGAKMPPAMYANDGCNVNANTMPEGLMEGYNAGKTAVHETGHWLGLLHTFEGNSCEGPGDYIEDTAPEAVSTEGCPEGKNTCPQLGGTGDPIHNFMDYSLDACYEGFTAAQSERMHSMWSLFREGN